MKLAYGKAPHNERQPLVANNAGSERDEAPQDSARLALILIAELSACLQMITGDVVTDVYEQLELFTPPPPDMDKRRQLMTAVDQINARIGRDAVRLAASGIERPWVMRQSARSPCYTTRWDELVRVY